MFEKCHVTDTARADRMTDAVAEAEERAAEYPAVTLADLHAKLALMERRGMGDGIDRTAVILADVVRIMGGEA